MCSIHFAQRTLAPIQTIPVLTFWNEHMTSTEIETSVPVVVVQCPAQKHRLGPSEQTRTWCQSETTTVCYYALQPSRVVADQRICAEIDTRATKTPLMASGQLRLYIPGGLALILCTLTTLQ